MSVILSNSETIYKNNSNGNDRIKNLVLDNFFPDVISTFGILFIIGLYIGLSTEKNILLESLAVATICFFISTFYRLNSKIDFLIVAIFIISIGIAVANIRKPNSITTNQIEKINNAKALIKGSCKGNIKYLENNELSFILENCKIELENQEYSIFKNFIVKVKNPEIIPIPDQYYEAHGIIKFYKGYNEAIFIAENIYSKSEQELFPIKTATKLRNYIYDKYLTYLPNRIYEYVIAFTFGDTSLLSKKDKEISFNTGMSHVMAVSGQHIGILVLFLASTLKWFKIPPLSRSLIIFICLILYALVSTSSASVWRAIVIYSFYVITYYLEAIPKPLKGIVFSAILLLIVNPEYLFSASFQLSFSAVLGIFYLNGQIRYLLRKLGLPELFSKYIAISWSANIATIPVTIYHFKSFPIISFITNPCLLWLFSIILPMSLIFPIVCIFSDSLALILSSGLVVIVNFFIISLELFANIPYSTISIIQIPTPIIFLILALITFLFTPQKFWIIMYYNFKFSDINEFKEILYKIIANDKTNTLTFKNSVVSEESSNICKVNHNKDKYTNIPDKNSLSELYKVIGSYKELLLFCNQQLVDTIQTYVSELPKRSLKGIPNNQFISLSFNVKKLTFENQNILNRLEDINEEILRSEFYRLPYAYLLLGTLLSNVFIPKLTKYIVPPLSSEEIKIRSIIKNKNIYSIIFLEFLINMNLSRRIPNNIAKHCYFKVKEVFPIILHKIVALLQSEKYTKTNSSSKNLSSSYSFDCYEDSVNNYNKEISEFFTIKSIVYELMAKVLEL